MDSNAKINKQQQPFKSHRVSSRVIEINEDAAMENGQVKLALRPLIVGQLVAKLEDKNTSPRQKVDMCLSSKVYSALLSVDQEYEVCENIVFGDPIMYYYEFRYQVEGTISVYKTSGKNKKDAEARLYKQFVKYTLEWLDKHYPPVDAQMDSTESTEQGPQVEEGEKYVNTIMTRGVPLAENTQPIELPQNLLKRMCTGQETPEFPIWQKRQIVLASGNLSINDKFETPVAYWIFPRDLYKLTNTPVNRPYEQFMFTRSNIKLTVKVNAQKFAVGRYLLGYCYEPLTLCNEMIPEVLTQKSFTLSMYNAIMRDHVYIDLGESNEGTLDIAFRNKTPYITSLTNNSKSVRGAAYVVVYLYCISPMKVIDTAPTTTPYTVFVNAEGSEFSGMRYLISPEAQMGNQAFKDTSQSLIAGFKSIPVIGGLVGGAANALGNIAVAIQKPFRPPSTIAAIESDLKYIGILGNRDKPTNIREPMEIRPNATGNLSAGTNIAEVIHPMRLDPTATTINVQDHLPDPTCESLLDYCRIWSLASKVSWAITDPPSKVLFSRDVSPGGQIPYPVGTGTTLLGSFTDCLSLFYTYYHGEVEFRFDIIANQFHTGILTCAYLPYHQAYTSAQATSGYWKIFDLREQKSFDFTVPYIANTVCRINSGASNIPDSGEIVPRVGNMKLFVTNQLNPVETAPSSIEILIYMRAGPNFRFSYPKPIIGNQFANVKYADMQYGVGTSALEVDAQMDDGSKEDIDQTPDFSHAMYGGLSIQTNEDHMHIKTLMRRWTHHGSIKLTANRMYLQPVCLWNSTNSSPKTIQTFIQRQFRWYRGSIRYMLVSTTAQVGDLVHITHLPQSNVLTYGDNTVMKTDPVDAASIHFSGMATEIFCPYINPVFKVEIPFHGVFDYLDAQYSTGISNSVPTTWVDRAATNLGHLAISSNRAMNLNLYIAAGDDCEFVRPNFCLGVRPNYHLKPTSLMTTIDHNSKDEDEPMSEVNEVMMTPPDEPRVFEVDAQMDNEEVNDPLLAGQTGPSRFRLPIPNVSGFCSAAYNRITNSMVSAMAPVTAGITTIRNMPIMQSRVFQVADNVDMALEYIRDAARNIVHGIKKSLTWVTNTGAIFSSVLHFLQALISPKWESFVIAITGVMVSIGCFCSDFAYKFLDFFSRFRPGGSAEDHRTAEPAADAHCEHTNCSRCRDQCDPRCTVCSSQMAFTEDTIGSLVSLMFASVAAWTGYKGEAPNVSLARGLFNFQKTFWTTIYQSGRFLTSLVKLVSRIFKWIGKKMGFGIASIALTEQNSQVEEFIKEATKMLDERNLQFLDTSPAIKYRFWYCVTAAHQMIAKFSNSNLPEATSICRLAFKVIERGNKVSIQSMACPVRYEPFVLALEGPSNIGKSYMFQQMLPKLMASEAYNIRTHAPPLCVRTPGVQFWNTYQNQPCIMYDDFLAVTTPEIAVPQVIELYNLKSSAQFNLNMANLEEKKMLGNPFVVAIACNNAFTTLNGTVSPEAFLRRKEHLWRVELKKPYKTLADVPEEEKDTFNMYTFWRYADPGKRESKGRTEYTYQEWFRLVSMDAKKYHEKEQKNVCKRLESLKALLPETARQMMHEVDPFRIFYAAYTGAADDASLSQGGLLPSELIDLQLREIVNMPENGGRAVAVQGSTPEPEEEASAQMEIGDLIPETVKLWFNWLLYCDPNVPPEHPENYIAHDTCHVCDEERDLVFGCHNNHKICQQCRDGIRAAADGTYNAPAYVCPTCRGDLYQLDETPVALGNALRPLVWAYAGVQAVKRAHNYTRNQVRRMIQKLGESPKALFALRTALVVGYLSGLSYICASSALMDRRREDDWSNLWRDSDDLWSFSYINRWGPFFYTTRDFLPRRDWRERMATVDPHHYGDLAPADAQMDLTDFPETDESSAGEEESEYEETDFSDSVHSISRGSELEALIEESRRQNLAFLTQFSEVPVDAQAPPPVPAARVRTPRPTPPMTTPVQPLRNMPTGPVVNTRLPMLVTPEHPQLERFINIAEPQKPTLKRQCRHLALLRADINDIGFEIDASGQRAWVVGLYAGEWIYDYPCQHANCAWNDRSTRFHFLNEWAWSNTAFITAKKQTWERTNGPLNLPAEFFREDALNVANRQRDALVTAVRQYAGQSWWDYIGDKLKACAGYVKLGLKIAGGIMMFLETFRFLRSCIQSTPEPEVAAELVNSGAFHTRRITQRKTQPGRRVADANISAEIEQRSVRLIEKNTIFLRVSYTEDGVRVEKCLRGLGLFGRAYAIPAHYAKFVASQIKKLEAGRITDLQVNLERFVNRQCSTNLELDPTMFRYSTTDLAFAITPPEFPMFKDISGYVPTVEQHRHIGGEYLHVECEANVQRITAINGTILGMIDRQRVRATANWEAYDIYDAYCTTYGRPGTCGSILVTELNAPLFAIHVAGETANPHAPTGYAIPLIREDIEDLKRGSSVLSYWTPDLRDAADAQMQLSGAIIPMGSVKKDMIAFMPKKTKIVPSLLQGQIKNLDGEPIPVITEPGILSPSDVRYNHDKSPLFHGCMKHTLPPKRFEKDILEYCVEQISSELNQICKPLRDIRTELTVQESIVGFNDRKYYDSIDLNTSAGWPWNININKTKKDFIKVVRDKHSNVIECKVSDDLAKVLEQNQAMRKEGVRPFTVFLDWLKDERRKHKKIELKDGTRVFSLSPIDFTIQLRQRFLDFSASFMYHREQTESAVGIVVDGPEWSRLANGLLNNSHHIVTGDYSDFGPRLASQVVRAAFEIMLKWYVHNGLEDESIMREMVVMCEEIANANHIMHDFIYQVMCGAPSGSSMTVIMNSLVNMIYIRYVWMKIFPASDAKEFKENVFLKVYGDDLIMSVRPEFIERFNCQVISEVLAEYDIKFTDAGKTGAEKYTTIELATFLKSGFLRHPYFEDQWLSPLEITSIHECAQWVWKSSDITAATLENVEQSLRLAYGHGPKYFDEWKKCLNRALNGMRLPTLALTWGRVDNLFFKLEYTPGTFTVCSRFDDGLGLNAFASGSGQELKEELRARKIENNVLRMLTPDPSGLDVSWAKGVRVVEREREEGDEMRGGTD